MKLTKEQQKKFWEVYNKSYYGSELENDFIQTHEGLVRNLCIKTSGKNLSNDNYRDSLFNSGRIGLMKAIRAYDKSKGVSFTTFAYPYIKGSIFDFFQELSMESFRKNKTREKNGEESVRFVFYEGLKKSLSYEEVFDDHLHMLMDNRNPNPREILIRRDKEEWVKSLVDKLPYKCKKMMISYFFDDIPLQKIAQEMKIQPTKANDIKKHALSLLKNRLKI